MKALPLPTWLNNDNLNDQMPAWFSTIRQNEWEGFLKNGFPHDKDERFKYTDLSFLNSTHFKAAKEASLDGFHDLIHQYRLEHEASIMLVFVNGFFARALSDIEKLPHPIKVCGLQEALMTEAELIQTFFALSNDTKKYPFASLNRAICNDGLLIILPEGYAFTTPIHLLSLSSAEESFIANPNHMILLNPHSQLTLIEEYVSLSDFAHHFDQARGCLRDVTTKTPGSAEGGTTVPKNNHEPDQNDDQDPRSAKTHLMNVAMTTLVGAHADFTHYKIQREGKRAFHMAHHFIHQKQDSTVNLMNFTFGGIFSRDEVAIHLEEKGVTCHAYGFYHLQQKNQYIDHHVDIDHQAPYSTSEMLYKGIIEQSSRAVFNGRLHVQKGAQKVVAHQENHHLILSERAESYVKPELQIYADDVKCKHGATTSEVDADALFYLRSRGIDKEEAMEILLQGFAASIIDRILHPSVKLRVESVELKR